MGFLRIIFAGSILLGIFSFGYADARKISPDEMRKINDSMLFLKIAGFDLKLALTIKNSLIRSLKSDEKIDDSTKVGLELNGKEATIKDIKATSDKKIKEKQKELKDIAKKYVTQKINVNKDGRDVFPYLFSQGNKLCKEIKILGGEIPSLDIPNPNGDGSTIKKPICT